MSSIRALHVIDRIAPLAHSGDAEVAFSLSRALARAGERVSVVTRMASGAAEAAAAAGLARRLDPLVVEGPDGPAEIIVYQGAVAGGEVSLWLLSGPEVAGDELAARAALGLMAAAGVVPDIIRATWRWPDVLSLARMDMPSAATALWMDDANQPLSDALARAIDTADIITVPSASYRRELLGRGEGDLAEALARREGALYGIAPGVDEAHFDPRRDPLLPQPIEPTVAGKSPCKRELRRALGLPSTAAGPLVVVIGPFELLDRDIAELMAHVGGQFVFAYPPELAPRGGDLPSSLAQRHPTIARVLDGQPATMHLAMAAADLALLPFTCEPGAAHPLYCMRYGAVPIAPRQGVFGDVLVDWDAQSSTGNGFVFPAYRPEDLATALRRAHRAHQHPSWDSLVERVANTDISWHTAALRHDERAQRAVRARREIALAAS